MKNSLDGSHDFKSNQTNFLGKYPGRTLHRIGVFIGSMWIVTGLLGIIWPAPDKSIIRKESLVTFKQWFGLFYQKWREIASKPLWERRRSSCS